MCVVHYVHDVPAIGDASGILLTGFRMKAGIVARKVNSKQGFRRENKRIGIVDDAC